jgi:hypothetical protein
MVEDDGENPWAADRQSAVEFLDLAVIRHRRPNASDARIKLPLDVARLVLDCAKLGLHKGQGRRRPPLTHGDKLRQQAIAAWCKRRKAKLHGAGMKMTGANSAEDQALEDARDFASKRYNMNLSIKTLKRLMQTSEF